MSDLPENALADAAPGTMSHGFRLTAVTPVPEIKARALILEHPGSGARLLHLHADDPENLFAIALRTPPPDDTGLPHILEHTVLCGSEKYPVKDPLVETIKVSLATFLNAMTYPDKTVYPCASMHRRDFLDGKGHKAGCCWCILVIVGRRRSFLLLLFLGRFFLEQRVPSFVNQNELFFRRDLTVKDHHGSS